MVITDVNQVTYIGDGITTAWPFTFRIIDASDIQLMIIEADGTETAVTSDYYVDTINNTVYYPGYAPGAEPPEADQPPVLSADQKLIVYRTLPITQEKDLGDKWPFAVIELGLDKLTMILQDIWDWCGRCLQVTRGRAVEAGDDFDPTVPLEAGKVICGNEGGTGFEAREALMEVNGAWDGEGRQIHDVADPSADQDAATKNYVDDNINYVDNSFMKLQEGGEAWESRGLPVSNVATPGKVKDAATKEYVDNLIDKLSVEADRYVVFNNVAAMKAADLPAGYNTRTLGYYDINDGGAGVYSIRGKVAGETEDGGSVIFLANGNVAELIIKGFVCPEQFGAKGDGTTDDSNAFYNALQMNVPVICTKTYLVASFITVTNLDSVEINGGTFIFNNGGTADFLYVTYTDKVSLKNATIVCTDGGFPIGTSYGTFFRTQYCDNVIIDNVKAENIYFIYRSNFTVTNDSSQYFMKNITISNVFAKNCICPFLTAYCDSVTISNFTSVADSDSASATREILYVTGGIKNLVCDSIYSNYSSRFYLHLNNAGGADVIDNTLRQNWVEHFSLTNSYFEYTAGCKSVIDPMCPVGEVTATNIVANVPIYRNYGQDGCICDVMHISNSVIQFPYNDGGGDIKKVVFDNCSISGEVFLAGTNTYPIDIAFYDCVINGSGRGYAAWCDVVGKLTIENCRVTLTNQSIQQILRATDLTIINNYFDILGINRLIFNSDSSYKVTAIGNKVIAKAYGQFIHQSPQEGIVQGNVLNGTAVSDSITKIAVTAVGGLNNISLGIGDKTTVTPTITPNNATNQNTINQNSDNSVATVARVISNGVLAFEITGVSAGTTTVTIRSAENSSILTSFTVTVS